MVLATSFRERLHAADIVTLWLDSAGYEQLQRYYFDRYEIRYYSEQSTYPWWLRVVIDHPAKRLTLYMDHQSWLSPYSLLASPLYRRSLALLESPEWQDFSSPLLTRLHQQHYQIRKNHAVMLSAEQPASSAPLILQQLLSVTLSPACYRLVREIRRLFDVSVEIQETFPQWRQHHQPPFQLRQARLPSDQPLGHRYRDWQQCLRILVKPGDRHQLSLLLECANWRERIMQRLAQCVTLGTNITISICLPVPIEVNRLNDVTRLGITSYLMPRKNTRF